MLRSAAAAAHAAAAIAGAGGKRDLRRALRRAQRREQWRAAALVLPLFAFVVVCFVAPIGAMLARGVYLAQPGPKGQQAHFHPIQVGLMDTLQVEVSSGLEEGQSIVTTA